MRWSKLKSEIESGICDSLKKRISIHSTAYGACTCGHAWITMDKEVIANFCTRAFWNTGPKFDESKGRFVSGEIPEGKNKKYEKQFVDYGEMSRQDVYKACWEFLNNLSIEEAISSDDPLIQSLAVIDKRIGKRRLQKLAKEGLHPLARKLFDERLKVESITQGANKTLDSNLL